jgi:hypothetical protein
LDTLANAANPWIRCLLFGTPRTYFRGITPVKASNQKYGIKEEKSVSVGAGSREEI